MPQLLKKYDETLIETIKRYNEIAPHYSRDERGKLDNDQIFHLKKFINFVGLPPRKILDAGCGTGKDILYLSSYGYELFGIDLSSGMLEETLKVVYNKNNIHLLREDFRYMSFSNCVFDGIWCSASLVHLPYKDKQIALQEFNRVLKKGGILSIGIQNLLCIDRLIRIFKSYIRRPIYSLTKTFLEMELGYAYYDKRHWFFPTKPSLIRLVEDAGFEIIESNNVFSKRLRIYAIKK
ncbi:MAG: class I SAM-dependent methyltransferase [Candidatus Aenigmatarchaeota archaeon]